MVYYRDAVLLFLHIYFIHVTSEETKEFCLREHVDIQCGENEVILVKEAQYGRMRSGRCINKEYGSLGCSVDVTSFLDGFCSGRQSCREKVRILIDIAQPCPSDLTSYTSVTYDCVKLAPVPVDACRGSEAENQVQVTGTEGYIPTRPTPEIGPGTRACPWFIQVGAGQRINLTIMDFNHPRLTTDTGPSHSGGTSGNSPGTFSGCPISMIVEEPGLEFPKTEDICTGGPNRRLVHITSGNTVSVHFISHAPDRDDGLHFLLKYAAVGCENLSVPRNAWLKRDDENAQVQCNTTGEIWYLTCRDGRWIGEVGECSNERRDPSGNDADKFPFGLILAVIIGIVLGVIVGVTLLGIVFLCRRGYKNRARRAAEKSYLEQQRPSQTAVDLYSEGFHTIQTKPVDPRMAGSAGDYGYKYSLHRKPNADTRFDSDSIRKPGHVGQPVQLQQQHGGRCYQGDPALARIPNFVHARSHVYESPKFMRGQEMPGEHPPVYHELDAENEDQSGRYTN